MHISIRHHAKDTPDDHVAAAVAVVETLDVDGERLYKALGARTAVAEHPCEGWSSKALEGIFTQFTRQYDKDLGALVGRIRGVASVPHA